MIFVPFLYNGFGFGISLKPCMFQGKHLYFAFKCALCNLSLFFVPLPPVLPFPFSFLSPCHIPFCPPTPPHLFLPPLSQYVVVNWPREVSLCGRVNTSVLWTTSECTELAASAARTSLKGRWCPPSARPTTLAASSVPLASKKQDVRSRHHSQHTRDLTYHSTSIHPLSKSSI